MIQLANDPNASRMSYRPEQSEAKDRIPMPSAAATAMLGPS